VHPELAWRPARAAALDLRRFREQVPLGALLVLAGAVYVWGLSRNGWANEYYAAAVQAGTHSWKAFLFGSLDAANYIAVDKPPASLWPMELSARLFGFSSFSMLLPQALEGIAAVALLYATVKRWFGQQAALLSGLILALTPVAALMFRFNNPDALLVLLLVLAAYALTRALEGGSTRWLAFTGGVLGFAFLAKELQAFLVLPAFVLVYLLAAPVSLRRRLWQLGVAAAALVLSAGWWIALVELWPAASRPYFGDSTENSVLQVIFGFNGLSRISSAGAGPGGGFSGSAGILRLSNSVMGGQISWLLPAAGIALLAGAGWTARRPRTDRTRAAVVLWGGWLVVSAAVYSFMTGIIHPYYTNTLAPAIAVLVGVGTTVMWRGREHPGVRLLLAAMLIATAIWSFVLLDRTPGWHPWLRFAILLAALATTVGICAGRHLKHTIRPAVATIGLLAGLAGPAAYTLSTVATSETGSTPSAGPLVAATGPFPGAARFPGAGRFQGAGRARSFGSAESVSRHLASLLERSSSRYRWVAATASAQTAAALELAAGKPVMAIGGFTGSDPAITLARFKQLVAQGKIHYYIAGEGFNGLPGGPAGRAPGGFRPRSGGGFPSGGFPGGGFGSGAGGFRPPPGGLAGAGAGPGGLNRGGQHIQSEIQSWVSSHFNSHTIAGMTMYDLTQPK
jgi:4-amino-4-deoxy-L-arabinose transferase-like glycosyltransferase